MTVAAVKQKIASQLHDLQKADGSINPDDLVAIIESVIDSIEGDMTAVGLKVYSDIEALARYINTARAEIAELRPDDINSEHIPAATDELTAIVGSTEQATHTIFDALDRFEDGAGACRAGFRGGDLDLRSLRLPGHPASASPRL